MQRLQLMTEVPCNVVASATRLTSFGRASVLGKIRTKKSACSPAPEMASVYMSSSMCAVALVEDYSKRKLCSLGFSAVPG